MNHENLCHAQEKNLMILCTTVLSQTCSGSSVSFPFLLNSLLPLGKRKSTFTIVIVRICLSNASGMTLDCCQIAK